MEVLTRWSWVFGLIGVLAWIGAGTNYYLLSQTDGSTLALGIAGALGLLAWAGLDRERVGETVSSRAFAYGTGSWLMVALCLSISVSAYVLARGHDKSWDMTQSQRFAISDQTRTVALALKQPVAITAFFRSDSEELRSFRQMVSQIVEVQPSITVNYVDPLANPLEAKRLDVQTAQGTVVLERKDGREERLDIDFSEEAVAKALLLLNSDVTHEVCWALGHGEPDPDDESSPDALGKAVLLLDGLNYQVSRLVVPAEGVPARCELVVIAAPRLAWQQVELEALAGYIAQGGRAFVLFEPSFSDELADDMGRYGVLVGRDVVLDANPENQQFGVEDPSAVVLSGRNLQPHAITRSMGAALVLPIARSVARIPDLDGLDVREVLRTSEQAWAETNFDAPPMPDDGADLIGEIPLMATVEVLEPGALSVVAPPEAGEKKGRLVVIGDASFADNRTIGWGNNRDLFLNSVAWLLDEEAQIGERPTGGDVLTITGLGEGVLCLVSIFFVPGALLGLAALTLLRRRRL